jgi:hypothetical protein
MMASSFEAVSPGVQASVELKGPMLDRSFRDTNSALFTSQTIVPRSDSAPVSGTSTISMSPMPPSSSSSFGTANSTPLASPNQQLAANQRHASFGWMPSGISEVKTVPTSYDSFAIPQGLPSSPSSSTAYFSEPRTVPSATITTTAPASSPTSASSTSTTSVMGTGFERKAASTLAPPLPTLHNLSPSLFASSGITEYACMICGNIPLRPTTPQCCGSICCQECYQNPASGECTFCGAAALEAIPSPYLSLKIGGETVKCLNYIHGCPATTTVGKDGTRLLQHLSDCQYATVACPGCAQMMKRHELAAHRGPVQGPTDCQHAPIQCEVCSTSVARADLKSHEESAQHRQGTMNRLAALLSLVQKMEQKMQSLQQSAESATRELEETKRDVG